MYEVLLGEDRPQATLFPLSLDHFIDDDNDVRAIDAFVNSLDLGILAFG